ncbi:MAG: hypothetical protein WBE90_28760 [Xanthobacteraceae bacterium]
MRRESRISHPSFLVLPVAAAVPLARSAKASLREALVACVTLGVVGTDAFLTHPDVGLADEATGTDQILLGSILFYPDTGSTCHQLYFNNQDGQFSDKGHVDCARAVADLSKDKPKNSSTARTEFISKGFR